MTFAADRSIPGDRLYGIDLLIEDFTDLVGITSDHAVERFEESALLLQDGRTSEAIATAWSGARERLDDDWAPHLQSALHRIEALSHSSAGVASAALDALLASAVRVDEEPGAAAAGIAAVVNALPPSGEIPPGLDPDFIPPGQDPDFIPPGQDPDVTPPGQDPDVTPPGQDPDVTPPGQDPDVTPPGQDPDVTPPGQDPDVTPPGQDPDFTPPGQGGEPPGQGQTPPGGQGNEKGNGG